MNSTPYSEEETVTLQLQYTITVDSADVALVTMKNFGGFIV